MNYEIEISNDRGSLNRGIPVPSFTTTHTVFPPEPSIGHQVQDGMDDEPQRKSNVRENRTK